MNPHTQLHEDVMIHVNNDNLASVITLETLKTMCPKAFEPAPTNPKVSERYVYVSTETVINDLAKLGWYPVEGKQCNTRKEGSVRSFHMIAFQNPSVKILKANGSNEVECFPRIILTNSHDGMNSFKFMIGLFRLVCSNGLVIATNKMADMRIRHINYTFEELRKQVAIACEQVNIQCEFMNKMAHTELTNEQKRELAKEAIRIRKGIPADKELEISEASISAILRPRRDEDNGNSLWNVFNVIQEHAIKGGFEMTNPNGKTRVQRPVKAISRNLQMNAQLFQAAQRYVEAEAV